MAFQYADVGTGESLHRRGSVTFVLLSVGKSDNPEDDQVIDGFSLYKQQPSKKTCGPVLHYRYSDRKKASIVSEPREIQSRRDEVIPNSGMTPLNSIGQKTIISISKISK